MAYLGIGNFSKHYFYIFVVFFCQFICDYLTVFNKDNDDESEGQKSNFINYNYKLENHFLIQNLLTFLGSITSGAFLYHFYKKIEQNKDGEKSIIELKKIRTEYFGEKNESINFDLFLIGVLYSGYYIIRTFLISQKFDAGFWTLEIIFIVYLSNKILKVKFGIHQKVTMILLSGFLFVFQIISFCLPRSKHACDEGVDCKEKYIYDNNLFILMYKKFQYVIFIIIILIIYFIDFFLRDYSWVKSKYLMDIRTVPTFKILLFFGIIGTIMTFICFIFTSCIPCHTYKNVDIEQFTYIDSNNQEKKIELQKQVCNVMDYNEKTKELKFYYDNIVIFFRDYKEKPLEILTLPLYYIMWSIISFSQIIMLKNLDSIILLVNINFNYFLGRLIDFVIRGGNKEYMALPLFLILEFEELFAILAYLIYMEIIELKFCHLDYDLKKNIDNRSKTEYEVSLLQQSNDEENKEEQEGNDNNVKENEENIANKNESEQ